MEEILHHQKYLITPQLQHFVVGVLSGARFPPPINYGIRPCYKGARWFLFRLIERSTDPFRSKPCLAKP